MDREAALEILNEYVQSESLKRHMYAVESAMCDYAKYFGEDPQPWGIAGLLHDFDWEIHPSLEQHPQDGAPILAEKGVPEFIIRCILSHADHTGVPRETNMQKSLFACDEITGLITAIALVRPSRSLDDLTLKSIKKKWKNDRFAAAIDRSEIQTGVDALGIDLWEHVERVLQSMRRIGLELGFNRL